MLNPINCVLNNIDPPEHLEILGFLRDESIAKRMSQCSCLMMGISRKETFSNDSLPEIKWISNNFINIDKNITPNLIITDNPKDCNTANEISVRYQVPLVIAISFKEWLSIRHMDRLLIQDKIPTYAIYIAFSQDKRENIPQLPTYINILSQEHLTKVLRRAAKQSIIL